MREDDIFVVSFPKCGTTLTMELCWLVSQKSAKKMLTGKMLTRKMLTGKVLARKVPTKDIPR